MKQIFLTAVWSWLFVGCSNKNFVDQELQYEGHPVVGLWSLQINGCTESYNFLPNGIREVSSNLEVVEASYTISKSPQESGFYKLVDTVISDNGKKDCTGSTADMTGDVAELYIAFRAEGNLMLVCYEESFERCFGPMKKQ